MEKRFLVRMAGLLFIVVTMFTLVACNSEETVTYQTEEQGISITLTYTAEDDKVVKQVSESEIEYRALGVTTKEEAEELLAPLVEDYQNIDGLTHEIEYQDDKVIEKVTVDYNEADAQEIAELEGSMFEGDPSEGISLEKSIELIESQGFEEVE
ncbi:YehR family lipoprotein [Oceanobacillus sp. 1P07AA]|uniref:YehR family lipoprotein n=1 Tax=Oceanobacillus sp. 1P07AA TaxID=3132293 RepID=UPI0039A4638F